MSIKQQLLALYILNLSFGACYAMEPEQKLVQAPDLAATAAPQLKITTSDNQEITVNRNLMLLSPIVRGLLEDVGNVEGINLTLTAEQVNTITNFLPDLRADKTEEIAAKVNKMEVSLLVKMVKAANYLALEELLDICLRAFAEKMNSSKDIECYIGSNIPKELMQRILKLIGATNWFVYGVPFNNKIIINTSCWHAFSRLWTAFIPETNLLAFYDTKECYVADLKALKPGAKQLALSCRYGTIKGITSLGPCAFRPVCASSLVAFLVEADKNIWKIYNAKNGTSTNLVNNPSEDFFMPQALTPDGSTLLIAGNEDEKIQLMDLKSGAIRTLSNFGKPYLSHDGSSLIVESPYHDISQGPRFLRCSLYEVKSGQCIHSFDDIKNINYIGPFSSDDRLIALANCYGNIYLWDKGTKSYCQCLFADGEIRSLSFSPDNALIAAALGTGNVIIWSVATGKKIRDFSCTFEGIKCCPMSLFFNRDGTALFGNFNIDNNHNLTALWDVPSGMLIATSPLDRLADRRPFLNDFSSDYSLIAYSNDCVMNHVVGAITIDKSLQQYLSREITTDQSLLLITIIKVLLKVPKKAIEIDEKMKLIYNSFPLVLKNFVVDHNKRVEADKKWTDETAAMKELCQKKRKRK